MPDEKKAFIRADVVDISVVDANTAFLATACGTIIKTTDGGANWTQIRAGYWDRMSSISFFRKQDGTIQGWAVGANNVQSPKEWFILRYANGPLEYVWTPTSGNSVGLPSGFQPAAIAAADAQHIWVYGNNGIWFSNGLAGDGKYHWTQHYASGCEVGGMWAGVDGTGYAAWAVHGNQLMRLNPDCTTWSEVANPLPDGAELRISGPDAQHVSLANGSGSFALWNGTAWTSDSSGPSAKQAVAWVGGNEVLSASGVDSSIGRGTGSPGSYAWTSTPPIPDYTWKMRHLVCRLDGYSNPTVNVQGYGPIPKDVKDMIDRSVAATGYGNPASAGLKFLLDGPWKNWPLYNAGSLKETVGTENVSEDESNDVYLNSNGTVTGDVIGYSSSGSYHWNAENLTRWYRPVNISWKAGAVGLYQLVSGDEYYTRQPRVIHTLTPNTAPRENSKLKVYLSGIGSDANNIYGTHWIALHRDSDGAVAASAKFDSAERIDGNRTAVIDLSTVNWTQNGTSMYLAVHFPGDDPLHGNEQLNPALPGEEIVQEPAIGTTTAFYDTQATGFTYMADAMQSLAGELIRSGCSATAGNVWEPGSTRCPEPETILRAYASGCTWAESAYMGIPYLSWMEIAVGDPLMSPFDAPHPVVSFLDPTPEDGARINGVVTLRAQAAPDAPGSIREVEFWSENTSTHQRTQIGVDAADPYCCEWDSSGLSGQYVIQAIAYQSDGRIGKGVVQRTVTLDNSMQASVAIANPGADYSAVTASTPVEAQAEGSPSRVDFWLIDDSTLVLVGTATASPYTCTIPASAAADGMWKLQAVAYYDNPSRISYSATRSVVVMNNSAGAGGIGSLVGQPDGKPVFLVGMSVTSGTSAVNNGGFYIEDESRAAGIRVQSSETISTGRKVLIGGVLHTGEGERYIQTDRPVYDMGAADMPQPLSMISRDVGGEAPDGTIGVSELLNPSGTYNTGLLVRVCGWVRYTQGNDLYIDDGGRADPDVAALEPIPVPLNGDPIPASARTARGLHLYLTDGAERPGIGDFITANGISSLYQTSVGGVVTYTPMVRVVDADSVSYVHRCRRAYGAPSRLIWTDNSDVPIGSLVRLEDQLVLDNSGGELLVVETAPGHLNACTSVPVATTAVQCDDTVTILGEYLGRDAYGIPSVEPEAIYLTASGSQQSGSRSSGLSLEGPMQAMDSEPMQEDAISLALSQPNGTSVSLSAVQVTDTAGGYFGVKGMCEALTGAPRLLVARTGQVGQSWIVDVQGTITMLAGGQRAIVPASVWLYTDAAGRPAPPWAWMVGSEWPHKTHIQ